jgi:3-oxoacyl-[acyl-carrier protein] reductase
MIMGRMEGKSAIVTGGSRGIGKACVLSLASEGAEVWFLYHSNAEAAEAVVEEAKSQGYAVHAEQADVRDGDRANQIVEQVLKEKEKLDILVNSAGIIKDGLAGAMTDEQWSDVVQTNLTGTFNYCRAASQQMMYKRSGSIVNLSSTASLVPSRGQVNYAASKGGINAFTRALAKELAGRKVRVNAVAPGMIETDMSEAVRSMAGDVIKKAIPMKRIGQPEEIARVVTFLAGDDAAYMTGQVLVVDGGICLGSY